MITFKSGTLIDEKNLNKAEAKSFIRFLLDEKERHIIQMNKCKATAERLWRDPILAIAYQTSAIRHYDDIQFTEKTIKYLKKKSLM